jgi:hypothetical protein
MIRSSALFISVMVSLMIVILCGTLIMGGFIYRMQQKQQERKLLLENNVLSGTNILLDAGFPADTSMSLSLFGDEEQKGLDSVKLSRESWGLYDLARVRSWIQTDTLEKVFLMAPLPEDSLMVLYVSDEDRPVSIAGKSKISGTAYLPKSGIRSAYVNGIAYADKTLVHGAIESSGRDMRELNPVALLRIKEMIALRLDSSSIAEVDLSGEAVDRQIVVADSIIQVDEYSTLNHVILIAPYVRIAERFKGNVQVFVTDSVSIGDSVRLEYPSAVVLLQNDTASFQAKLSVGKYTAVQGPLLVWQQERRTLMPVLSLADSSCVEGEVWSKGYVKLGRDVQVKGSVSAIRLMASHAAILYENYLIDVRLDAPARSRYYLSSALLNSNSPKRKILCWLR